MTPLKSERERVRQLGHDTHIRRTESLQFGILSITLSFLGNEGKAGDYRNANTINLAFPISTTRRHERIS